MYIIRHEVAEYHPSENEYISLSGEYLIITEFQYTLKRDDMHANKFRDDMSLLRNG